MPSTSSANSPGVPTVSVAMPLWRPNDRYLREAIESLQAQSLTDWELVIVEDPSETSAAPLIAELGDARVRHIANPERTGLAAQRGKAVELCQSNFVALLDGDDVCEPVRLAQQYDYLREHPEVVAVGCQLTIIDSQSRPTAERDYPVKPTEVAATMRRYNALAHPSVMFRRDVIVSAGNYRDDFPTCDDYELWCRLLSAGHKIANLPQRLLRYRVHQAQMKSTRLRQTLRETTAVKRRYFAGQMSLRERLQCRLEDALQWVPAGAIHRLFQRVRYRTLRPQTPA